MQVVNRPHHSTANDVANLAQVRDVGRWIAADDDEIGVLPLLDRAELRLAAHGARGDGGRRDDHLHRRHAGGLHRFHLGVDGRAVQRQRIAGVGAGGDRDAGVDERLQILRGDLLQFRRPLVAARQLFRA